MARNYEILEYMHNSIYSQALDSEPYSQRKVKIYFSEPDAGINEDTGILLFIAGYGGNANSNVYKKMRDQFADKHNFVTVQCDYFGYEFMQGSQNINDADFIEALKKVLSNDEIKEIYSGNQLNYDKLIEIGRNYDAALNVRENLQGESFENFNDMGIMQALDNIVAVLRVMSIIYENGYEFNTKKIVSYGQSQGAYLGYLCNRFCPTLFSHMIDNSAWTYPEYIPNNRALNFMIGNMTLHVRFEYLASKIDLNHKILDLNHLYSNFENDCEIISYHGTTDSLISHIEKRAFCSKIKNCTYNEITEEKIDGVIFKSTSHGLGADFLKLFDHVMEGREFEKDTFLNLPEQVIIKTPQKDYCMDYRNVLPVFSAILNGGVGENIRITGKGDQDIVDVMHDSKK